MSEQTTTQQVDTFWPLPETLDQAVRALYAFMPDDAIEEFRKLDPEQSIEFHHGLGRRIRNQLALWRGNKALLEACGFLNTTDEYLHEAADGASQVIIKGLILYVQHLHGKTGPQELQGYWWCPNCREECNPVHVTYAELHEPCGHPATWIEPDATNWQQVVEQAKAALEVDFRIDDQFMAHPDINTLRRWVEFLESERKKLLKILLGTQTL